MCESFKIKKNISSSSSSECRFYSTLSEDSKSDSLSSGYYSSSSSNSNKQKNKHIEFICRNYCHFQYNRDYMFPYSMCENLLQNENFIIYSERMIDFSDKQYYLKTEPSSGNLNYLDAIYNLIGTTIDFIKFENYFDLCINEFSEIVYVDEQNEIDCWNLYFLMCNSIDQTGYKCICGFEILFDKKDYDEWWKCSYYKSHVEEYIKHMNICYI